MKPKTYNFICRLSNEKKDIKKNDLYYVGCGFWILHSEQERKIKNLLCKKNIQFSISGTNKSFNCPKVH